MKQPKPHALRKQTKRILLAASNVSRSVFASFFGLLINYVLVRFKSPEFLQVYVYCITTVNLLVTLVSWGGKDYSLQTYARQPAQLAETTSALISSRILLLAPLLLIFVVAPFGYPYRPIIALLLMTRTFFLVLEPLVIIRQRIPTFLRFDFLLSAIFLVLVLLDGNTSDARLFLWELLAFEVVKLLICYFWLAKGLHIHINLQLGLSTLKNGWLFFLSSVMGFICSRADLYVVALRLERPLLSDYYILSTLLVVCQVAYSAFITTFSAGIYRSSRTNSKKFFAGIYPVGLLLSLPATLAIYFVGTFYFDLVLSSTFILLIFLNICIFSVVTTDFYRLRRTNRQLALLKVIGASGAVNLAFSFLLTSYFGILGALTANTLAIGFTALLLRRQIQRGESKS